MVPPKKKTCLQKSLKFPVNLAFFGGLKKTKKRAVPRATTLDVSCIVSSAQYYLQLDPLRFSSSPNEQSTTTSIVHCSYEYVSKYDTKGYVSYGSVSSKNPNKAGSHSCRTNPNIVRMSGKPAHSCVTPRGTRWTSHVRKLMLYANDR